jgi:glucuronate isomerase
MGGRTLMLHPDRLLPADPATAAIARRLYAEVRDAPIVSPHGHVSATLLADNEPFSDPASLFVSPDHYVTRMLHAHGVPLERLGVPASAGPLGEARAREVWRELCSHWHLLLGTPVQFWLESQLGEVFGLDAVPSVETADRLYDGIAECLATEAFRPRALFERFRIAVLATTDDPCDDLQDHARLRDDPQFVGRVIPTFRPDRYLNPESPTWRQDLSRLADVAGFDTGDYTGVLDALRVRRRYFIDHGATSLDVGLRTADSDPLSPREASALHSRALADGLSGQDAARYRANMLYQQAAMSVDDGLTLQLHVGVLRNHHAPTLERFGPDTGHDLPTATTFVEPLRPLLDSFGTHPSLTLVLFTVDETTFSRELAPLAGFYPSVYVGAPWWFLDTPAAGRRFREATTDAAGFYKTSGFIDDTRAFCSIPSRHDMSRRVDSSFLAQLVATHQLDEDSAAQVGRDLVGAIPRKVFAL